MTNELPNLPTYPPRVWIDKEFWSHTDSDCILEAYFKKEHPTETEYLSLEEHAALLREARAAAFAEIEIHCGHPDAAEALRIILKKARQARESP